MIQHGYSVVTFFTELTFSVLVQLLTKCFYILSMLSNQKAWKLPFPAVNMGMD